RAGWPDQRTRARRAGARHRNAGPDCQSRGRREADGQQSDLDSRAQEGAGDPPARPWRAQRSGVARSRPGRGANSKAARKRRRGRGRRIPEAGLTGSGPSESSQTGRRPKMTIARAAVAEPERSEALDFDAIVVGAGISGLYQLHLLRQLGMRVRVFETGTGVGGTWYWNRYPGARFDSESYSYGYSFSQELLEECDWTEHFSPQPETERYLNYVADKFDLRRDIRFSSRVTAAVYDAAAHCWEVTIEDGSRHTCRDLVTAVGPLSAPTWPRVQGIDDFRGEAYHTARWPKHPVSFEGKRVAVIGTGATGVQAISEIAKTAGHLTVFQRRPNWCTPLHNRPIDREEMERIRAGYP